MRRILFIFCLNLFFVICGQAAPLNGHGKIANVIVHCSIPEVCNLLQDEFKSLKGIPLVQNNLKAAIKHALVNSDIESLYYQVEKMGQIYILHIYIKNLPFIKSISFPNNIEFDFLKIKSLLSVKEGEHFRLVQIEESRETIKKILEETGHLNPVISAKIESNNGLIDISFNVDTGEVTTVENIEIISSDIKTKLLLKKRLAGFLGKPWNGFEFNLRIGQINDSLVKEGYLYSKINLKDLIWIKEQNKMSLQVEADIGRKYLFSFYGNKVFSRQELIKSFKEVVGKSTNTLDVSSLENSIYSLYKTKGFYNVKISSKVRLFKLKSSKEETTYFFIIEEGKKLPIVRLTFEGNQHLPNTFLYKFVKSQASVLVSRQFYDEDFFADFPNQLKKLYWANGFLFINIVGPNLRYGKDQKTIDVNYRISEGNRTFIDNIEISGVSDELRKKILERINNKIKGPFNPETFSKDQEIVVQTLQEEGYFYASIKNQNDSNLLVYSNGYSKANIYLDIDLKDIIRLDQVLIVGNVKTKNYVIEREIELKEGDKITPLAVEKIKYTLTSLGLFSTIKVIPLEDSDQDGKVNLLVSVKERNFGSIEITPGFRTDLGAKIGVGGTYNNLWGTNRTISLKSQLNQRTNLNTLDSQRREQNKKVLEYSNQFNYNEPYLMGHPVSMGIGFNSSKRRFRSFDANIVRTNATISKIFNKTFSSSIRYQFETIAQTDATNREKDEGSFTIGGITPSVSMDFRNNRINTRKGSFFNLSCEFANPYLLSEKDADIEINYIKLVSRNRFYIPIPDGVLALSYSMGLEQNLARSQRDGGQSPSGINRRGRIPSIKAFRLNGIDVVRGYADNEINMLDSKKDIQDVVIDSSAYFSNLKIEPRFFVNDNFILGLFFDGGKVFLNRFDPFSLHSSVGVSLKYLTPVGTLDLDFGVKLHRRRMPDGDLESPSRIHLSIGFF